jgi:diguanylate cyclase (GGDEF)-like protein
MLVHEQRAERRLRPSHPRRQAAAAVPAVVADVSSRPEDLLPPSVVAARAAGPRDRQGSRVRAYERPAASEDLQAVAAELAATQALMRATSAAEVGAVVSTLVRDLGGALIPARYADPATSIPVDVSMGVAEPLLPFADPASVAAMQLGVVLPGFLETAQLVLSRLYGDLHSDDEPRWDHPTGVLTRRAWLRRLSRAVPGDSVCLVRLDRATAVHDTGGQAAEDQVLRAIGGLVLRTFRRADSWGRYGAEELVCLAPGMPVRSLLARCEHLPEAWAQERPVAASGVGLRIGVAAVGEDGGRAALQSADPAVS